MPAGRRPSYRYRYDTAMTRQVAARAPLAFATFLSCVALSTAFEIARFPGRRGWMLAYAAAFTVLSGIAWWSIRRLPDWSAAIFVAFVNLVGIGLNTYHATVGAPVAMCIWTLSGLLGGAAVILPWRPRHQSLATVGTLLAYPVHLAVGTADPLTWAAGGTYLVVVSVIAVFASAVLTSYARADIALTAALAEREVRLQSYFDLAMVGTAILGPAGRCMEVNDELCRMLGWDRDELEGKPWIMLAHPEDRAAAGTLLETAASPQTGRAQREMRCLRKDGTTADVIVSARGLPGLGGAIDHTMVLVHDITDRKRAEAEREHAKNRFLAAVSHELRTPLSSILAWSALIGEGRLADDQIRAALATVQRNARAQAILIDDLLDVSRALTGEWRLDLRPLELAPVVRAAVDVVRASADAEGVVIEASLPSESVPIVGDAQRLQQVVWNLLANAVKFTPRGGRIDVALSRVGTTARIVVRDTGAGITPEFLPHVFDLFRQVMVTGQERRSLGVGLAIVRGLVERHGGSVRAESAGEGKGATFTVELPLGDASVHPDATAGTAPAADEIPVTLHGLRVLVVDDDADSNVVVRALLTSVGAEVQTATSVAAAVAIAAEWRPDVLVTDLAMPGEDGYALVEQLRARHDALRRVPAIALTAHNAASDRVRVREAGFYAHVAKPFDPAQLALAVETAAQSAGY